MAGDPELPGLLPSLGRALRLAYRAEPRLLVVSFALVAGAWVPESLGALWLKLLADGVVGRRGAEIVGAIAGLAGSVALGWLLRTVGGRVQLLFRERATVAIEAHVVRLQASVAGIEHHERPEHLDRLQLLKDQAFLLNHLYGSFFETVGLLARLAITIGLLASIHPALAGLALFALPAALTASWRAGAENQARERAAPHLRLSRHLFDVGTTAGPGKDVRVSGVGQKLAERRRAAWEAWLGPVSAARWRSAAWHSAAWTLFGAAFVGAIVFVALGIHASAGSVLLVLAGGGSLARYLGSTVATAQFLRWTLDASCRLAWLEDYAGARAEAADGPAPERIERGIRLEGVSFRYPGTERDVLRDVDLTLPAGAVVAVVGENGAGKSTLVKLLCRFYEPTRGRISVDGVDLARVSAASWRERIAGAFQDFVRFELRAGRTIGLGDLPNRDLAPALEAAVERGGATDVIERLPLGLETQLGPTWTDGVELSFGQWQKLALARGFMRPRPLLLLLDEPTAALDAETEHELFEAFAARSRAAAEDGRVTVLVSHRFSTVRMADLIVVLDGARVAESGTHDELMALGGLYAELYAIQARAYR